MTLSADKYYDETDFCDVHIVSTLGLTDEDVAAVSKIEGVIMCEGSKSVELFAECPDNQPVMNVVSLGEKINQFSIQEGRLPVSDNECFMDVHYMDSQNAKIGDKVKLLNTKKEVPEELNEQYYTIVGYGTWAWYLNLTRGTASIGDGSVDAFMVVVPEAFTQDYYTSIYATVHGAKDVNCYEDIYDEIVAAVTDRIDEISEGQIRIRHDEIVTSGQEAIDDAKSKVDDAKKELADAEGKLSDGESEYASGKNEYDTSAKDLESGRAEYESGVSEWNSGKQQYEQGLAEYEKGKNEYEKGVKEYEDGVKELNAGKAQLADSRAQLDDGWKQYNDGMAQYEEGKKTIAQNEAEIEKGEKELAAAEADLNAQKAPLVQQKAELEAQKADLEAQKAPLVSQRAEVAAQKAQLDAQKADLEAQRTALEQERTEIMRKPRKSAEDIIRLTTIEATLIQIGAGLVQVNAAMPQVNSGLAQLDDGIAQIDGGIAQIDDGLAQINGGLAQIEEGEKEIAANKKELADGRAELNAGKAELDASLTELNAAKAELEAGEASYADGMKEIAANEQKLAEAKVTLEASGVQIADGAREMEAAREELSKSESQLNDAKKTIEDGEKQLDDAKVSLDDARKELDDGWDEYNSAKKEADEKIGDAEKEIADGEKKLSEIKDGKWYILTRNENQTSVEYGMDAERIGKIASVFPVIFFLVAALVSLTTMTRMIEEERMLIGTMKALGYDKFAIISKYLFYAFSSTAIGGILGVLIGSKLLPYVILKAYGMLYTNVPYTLLPYNLKHCLTAIGFALLCTVGAAFAACYRELLSTPAALMRPPAPKSGRKILLERIPFIWSRLKFSRKSTIRNLVRYKKRFFMTVFGIGGCMAILLVSNGIHDSIKAIVDNQYKNVWTYSGYCNIDENLDEEEKIELVKSIKNEEAYISDVMLARNISLDVSTDAATKSAYLYVVESTDKMKPFLSLHDRVTKEKYTLNDSGVVISEKLGKLLEVGVGDTIQIEISDAEYRDVTVTAIAENYLLYYVYMTPALYEKVYGEPVVFNECALKYKKAVPEEEEDQMAERILARDGITGVSLVRELQESVDNMLNALNLVVWVLVVAAGLLVFVVSFNLNNINISERRRELASLKVLGFFDKEVAMYVYRENLLLTIFGIIAGIFMGTWLHKYVITTLEVELIMFGREISIASYISSSLLTVLFSVLVNVMMYYKLKQIDMVESLKSVE